MLNFKKILMSILGLLMITTLVGCNPFDSKNANKQAADEEKIDKVLQGFERMKTGEIHIVNTEDGKHSTPLPGEPATYHNEKEFTGTFYLRQDLILGKFKNEAGVVYDYYYEDGELYYKLETQSQWKRKKYDTDKHERPVGIQRDTISYFRTIKDQFTITEDKETITIHYQNSDIDFLSQNSDLFATSANNRFHFFPDDKSAELNIDLTVSKKDYTPLSVTFTCSRRSYSSSKEKMVSQVTYSNINSGIHVEAPSGVENAISDEGELSF